MNKARNPLPAKMRKKAVVVLNNTVTELFDVFARLKQAHWSVRGTTFIGLHRLLDEFADRTLNHIDLTAERVTALGGGIEVTKRENGKPSSLKPKKSTADINNMSGWVQTLVDVHAAAGDQVRIAIKKLVAADDFGTVALLTDVLRSLDLQLWLLEAHINRLQKN